MTRTCTDAMRSVDVRKLYRGGHLKPSRVYLTEWFRHGTVSATLRATAGDDGIWVEYRSLRKSGDWQTFSRLIALERTPCHLGGERVWWLCPGCANRVAILYGGHELACRKCWGLAYRCGRETRENSSMRQSDKLRKKLGWPAGILNGLGSRPKGMHQATYERLRREAIRRSASLLGLLRESLYRKRPR
jgi:hypothetical protein